MHSTPQESLQTLIQPFGLTICLWMVRRAHDELSVSEFEQISPHCTCENSILSGPLYHCYAELASHADEQMYYLLAKSFLYVSPTHP